MSSSFRQLETEIEDLIAAGAFPGGVVCIASSGSIAYLESFGNSVMLPQKIQAKTETVYDVASLTKPLITTTLILRLIQDELLEPDTTLGELFVDCSSDKKSISIKDLLTHSAGFIDWYPLYSHGAGIEDYRDFLFRYPLQTAPRKEVVYSCPGFVILAAVIEKVSEEEFVSAADRLIIRKLGLKRTALGKSPQPLGETAATEDSSNTERDMAEKFNISYEFRKGIIWGEPHDTNSFAAGGTAGNSGLFTTAAEALALSEQYSPRSILLSPEILSLVGRNETPFGPQHRTLGWQLASSPDCSAGPDLSPDSIGHTGFTGCSIWFDRKRDLTIILFTNRIHPQVSNVDMGAIRRRICSLSVSAIS